MTASYPTNLRAFSTKRNTLDIVDAADPNSIQEEVIAIENILGVNPNISTAPVSSGTFVTTSTAYSNLTARLANIETGIVSDSHTQYIRRTGNETITNATASNVALTVKGAASQTADIQQWKNSSGTVLASIEADGTFVAAYIESSQIENQIVASMWS
jgi:hypothetical protein